MLPVPLVGKLNLDIDDIVPDLCRASDSDGSESDSESLAVAGVVRDLSALGLAIFFGGFFADTTLPSSPPCRWVVLCNPVACREVS